MSPSTKIRSAELDDVSPNSEYGAPRTASGVRWSKRVSPEPYSIWIVVSQLEDGGTLNWGQAHGDDAVYVMSGSLNIEGAICPTDGAVVVESDVACAAQAVGVTQVVHFGANDAAAPSDGLYGAPETGGHAVHVLGDKGWFCGEKEGVLTRWFADSTCPTCRISLFYVQRAEGGVRARSHTHSQDELMFVLEGNLIVSGSAYGPGTCVAIPAFHRYSTTTGPDGFAFLNYRRDVSMHTYRPGEAVLERGLGRNGRFVGAFR
jgi:hypothetical protein